jgi:BirA family transcriptional regulator, biotin operon repressor / biotin---[acetyl-CoA-carboxylase] ligase
LKSNLPDDRLAAPDVPGDVHRELLRQSARLGAIGTPLHWLRTTRSTNDVASSLVELGAEEGTTVVAEEQTAGRGRLGRTWCSAAGAGLYVSVILRPSSAIPSPAGNGNQPALITLAIGVAVGEAVRAVTGLPAELKWPNDVMIGKRKLAGILAEGSALASPGAAVVVGIGVNLQRTAYPPDVAARATSIEAETNRPADRAVILAEILACVSERYAQLRAGRFDAILSDWRRLAPSMPSAPVEWDSPRGVMHGHAEGIDEAGALVVRVGDRSERIIAGEVRWV